MRSIPPCFGLALAVFPAAGAALSGGCGFPDVVVVGDTGSAGAGAGGASSASASPSTAAGSSDAAGSGGGAAGSGGGDGDGGAVTSGGSGDGGAAVSGGGGDGGAASGGGPAASSSGAGAATSGSGSAATGSGGGVVDCDVDSDGYRSTACEGGNDCNDNNRLVHPNQPSVFYDTPISSGGGFDYDCSGEEEREFPAVSCSGLVCTAATNVFLANVACGSRGPLGNCNALCQSTITYPDSIRACH
ncbi:hypothetical protein [Sorangium sp. So ce131]|uniref:hypothetical protein n=1 Tax=Sorangium sp. So ce131 TaxID=3133282 RepID=UPI003F6387D0